MATVAKICRGIKSDGVKMLMTKDIIEVVDKLTGSCRPYGDTSIDEERYMNLLTKMELAQCLLDEIYLAGELHERPEFSIKKISETANEFLADIKDWLNDQEHLGESEE